MSLLNVTSCAFARAASSNNTPIAPTVQLLFTLGHALKGRPRSAPTRLSSGRADQGRPLHDVVHHFTRNPNPTSRGLRTFVGSKYVPAVFAYVNVRLRIVSAFVALNSSSVGDTVYLPTLKRFDALKSIWLRRSSRLIPGTSSGSPVVVVATMFAGALKSPGTAQ